MAFPTVAATQTSSGTNVSGTSHSLSYPSGVSSGDLLVGVVAARNGLNGQTPGVSWPAGWTEIGEFNNTNNNVRPAVSVAYRVADGTESGSASITTAVSCWFAGVMYRITGADTTTNLPDVTGAFTGTGEFSTSLDPPSHTAAITDDNLWLAAVSFNVLSHTLSSYPTGYSNGQNTRSGTSGNQGVMVAAAEKTANAASDNPSAFAISAGALCGVATVAVYPETAEAAPTGRSVDIDFSTQTVTVTQGRLA